MNKFLTDEALENAVYDIIWDAEKTLLIVSPYIKLDNYFKELFDKHQNNPNINITIIFGKNEDEICKSLCQEDFDFFKKFPNISIIYAPKLHAKYYGNEKKGLITSINLYDYSFKNNIEFGIYSEQTTINQLRNNPDVDAWHSCFKIANENDAIFIKRPVFENRKFIINIGKNYIHSKVLLDQTEYFYTKTFKKYNPERLDNFPMFLEATKGIRPDREEKEFSNIKQVKNGKKYKTSQEYGYCIRTGERIKFNPQQPLSKEAWRVWNEYGNLDFQERFCHQTGKPSYGKTSMRNPILFQD